MRRLLLGSIATALLAAAPAAEAVDYAASTTNELIDLLDDATPEGELLEVVVELVRRGDATAAGPLAAYYLEAERLLPELQRAVFALGAAEALPALVEGWDEYDEPAFNRLLELARRADSPEAHGLLMTLLAEGDADERTRAAYHLGRLRYGAAADELLAALDDESRKVRLAAAEALGLIGVGVEALLERADGSASLPETGEALAEERAAYLRAALRITDPRSDALFVELLGEPEMELADELLELLRLRRPRGWEAALLEAARDYPPALLRAAELDAAGTAERALELLEDDGFPAGVCLRVLNRLNEPLNGADAELATGVIQDLLSGEDPERGYALQAALLLPRDASTALILDALGLGDGVPPELKPGELRVLGGLGGETARSVLVSVAEDTERTLDARAAAVTALYASLDEAAPTLRELTSDAATPAAAAACWALRGDAASGELLAEIVADDERPWPVGLAAAAALAYLGDDQAIELVQAVLETGDNAFALTMLGYLEELPLEPYLESLTACLGGRSLTAGTGYPARELLARADDPTLADEIAETCRRVLQTSEEPQARDDALWVLETRRDAPARNALEEYIQRP